MDRALRIVPHVNSRVTLLAKGQFSAPRTLACFKISLTQLCLRARVADTLNLLYRVNGLDKYVGQLQRRLTQLHYTLVQFWTRNAERGQNWTTLFVRNRRDYTISSVQNID